jgi:YHS domain-containing protein
MIRTIVWLLASVLLITFLRGVIGILVKGVSQLFQPDESTRSQAPHPKPQGSGFGGELVKDPVCGVFVSPVTALKKAVHGETHYFCSEACRDKFNA